MGMGRWESEAMAKERLPGLPFPPLVRIESDSPLTWPGLQDAVGKRLPTGVSICVIAEVGTKDRGGYYFHIRETTSGFSFLTFKNRRALDVETPEECVAFINHVSGRQYSPRMWELAQRANLRADGEG